MFVQRLLLLKRSTLEYLHSVRKWIISHKLNQIKLGKEQGWELNDACQFIYTCLFILLSWILKLMHIPTELRTLHSTKKWCLGHDTKLYLILRLQFWRSEECGILLHCYYSMSTDWVVVSVRISYGSIRSIWKLYIYMILYNCKLFVLRIGIWSNNCLSTITWTYITVFKRRIIIR